ncbi:OLC1v1020181C1 [Oldenlandia corymbosa var. corymbosa]|uniref:OLC1v1020181C1 n=1 Tax=Oldenlandia corymbosa var. corymbosa TaxID=529605 RepID=A0AAV1EFS7_OLDCO|nr:OLC1v1020181C1 [Oldenlandia corymbosa var. corymbosa]
MAHIAVERNRRRQMNEHLKVLRSLTPCFYIKRGDQASIIGGVVEFIKELHQVVQSLEAKKRRKSLSPSPSSPITPKPLMLLNSPQSTDQTSLISSSLHHDQHSFKEEVVACCNSPVADVEAKISGSNVVLRTVSKRIQAQLSRIIGLLEKFSFEILHLNVSSMEDTVLYSFVIKIGLECQLSLEELATEVQRSFSQESVYAKEVDC